MKKTILRALFVLYVLFLIWVILLKTNFSLDSVRQVREVNLIPFHYENVQPGDIPWMEALANFLIFVPFGVLLQKSWNLKARWYILIAAGLSLVFELTQYILAIGATDITDFRGDLYYQHSGRRGWNRAGPWASEKGIEGRRYSGD